MPRNLPKDDSEGRDYIQFRGRQTSVTHDDTGVRFETEQRGSVIAHKPLPVVDPDNPPEDVPDDAVARPVAEQLVESNPLICWGVACEEPVGDDGEPCGDVFDTPGAEASHRAVHSDHEAEDGEGPGGDGDDA